MIDIDRICLGCMQEKPTAGGECPYCGFDVETYEHETRWLPLMHILNGRYMLGKVLGEGGFGITYIGIDLNLQSRVAIKEYFPLGLVSRETTGVTRTSVSPLTGEKGNIYDNGLRKFVEEAQGVSKFDSLEGIVTVKDFFFENATAYMVMEYLDGSTLKAYLKEHEGKIPAEQALKYIRPIIEALQKVHESGMIHRDISPDNIMLTKEGKVKLIDFGSARALTRDENQTFTIMLKHGYAPPEQKYFSELGIQAPAYVEQVIKRGMALQIQNRYQSMKELYADLYLNEGKDGKKNYLKPPTPQPPIGDPGSKPPAGRKKFLIAGIIATAAVVIGFVAYQKDMFLEIKVSDEKAEQASKTTADNSGKKGGTSIIDIAGGKDDKDTDETPEVTEEPEITEEAEDTAEPAPDDEAGFTNWEGVDDNDWKEYSDDGAEAESVEETLPDEKVTLMSSAPNWEGGNYQPIPVLTANATSTISQKNTDNSAMMLFDDRDDTTWQEGVDGYGIGERVDFNFGDNNYYKVKYMGFKMGNWKNDKYYVGNAKPRTLTISFGNYSEQVTFNDVREIQWVEIDPAESVNCMSITIDDVYAGTSWEDTCITEILLYAES